jgi:hypothetical protein
MKRLLLLFVGVRLFAFASQPGDQGSTAPAGTDSQAPAAAATDSSPQPQAQPAATPPDAAQTDAVEPNLSGDIDFGYRYLFGVAGNFDAYRSVVNLGSGVKVLAADFSYFSPANKWFDRVELHGTNWADPYNTVRFNMGKSKLYNFAFNWTDIASFNFLPSWADVTINQGILLNQQSLDMYQKNIDAELNLLPGHWFQPYFAFGQYSNSGTGITDYVVQFNQYPLPYNSSSTTDNYRGGVHFEFSKWHVTLEQGGTTYSSNQQISWGGMNSGNEGVDPLFVTNVDQAYRLSGSSIYTRGLFTANPFSWLDLSGQFLYSQPEVTTNYSEASQGSFYDAQLGYVTALSNTLNSYAQQPHNSGSFNAELRPFKRLRLIESWSTDRLHSSGWLNSQGFEGDQLVENYTQNDIEALYELFPWLTLRGGYRYISGNSTVPASELDTVIYNNGNLRENVGIGGLNFRLGSKFTASWDLNVGSGSSTYFSTSLVEYTKSTVHARYRPFHFLQLAYDGLVLEDSNPIAGPHNNASQVNNSISASVVWNKYFSVVGDYTHSSTNTNYTYVDPYSITSALSVYNEQANLTTIYVDFTLPGKVLHASLGGSFVDVSGSRPTTYYQPMALISVPINKHVAWKAEWHNYQMNEAMYSFEAFRTNLFETGFRISLQ